MCVVLNDADRLTTGILKAQVTLCVWSVAGVTYL